MHINYNSQFLDTHSQRDLSPHRTSADINSRENVSVYSSRSRQAQCIKRVYISTGFSFGSLTLSCLGSLAPFSNSMRYGNQN